MAVDKFDETDRRAVLDAISQRCGTTLKRVGRRRKWFRDAENRHYWILGGYGDWHGVPAEMMDAEVTAPSGGFLVIALRERSALTIFIGQLGAVVSARTFLSRSTTGDYQFTLRRRGHHLVIDQIPNASLTELADFSFSDATKSAVAKRREAERLLASLTSQQRRALLEQLKSEA